ncbi:TonB-dependent receptor [Altericroceibacterium spongiae]|uniref:TonB-dependent receptor n=1 Tax=Altericroceibacterium spongiae TaxID=2320269 RepID=A0A420ER27_9SPHN|nr:TonB-dependent receptor [Altericroceibacterium spongiae]RKF23129.1 TonB-dependent receptor [Altericroceibacterium spongiae]
MTNDFCRKALLTSGISLFALIPGTAFAETAAAAPAPVSAAATAADQGQIGTIVVTAERRDVTLQDAPLAVSALNADTLEQGNIQDITGLNGVVPGLVVAKSGGGERIISIRGIGSETPENTNTQPGVSYHVDGVYIFNSIAASAAFIDVGQVEVLRGPQGTMFGQGSTGGTINVVTNKPKIGETEAKGDIGFGNYGLIQGNVGLNVPIGDTLAVRGYVQHASHDGFAKATDVVGDNDGDYELDDEDNTAWRVAAQWEPTDTLSIMLNATQYDSDTHGPAQKNILDPNDDARELTQDFPAHATVDTDLYYGTVALDLGFATAKSITSYQKLYSDQAWDADGLTADLFYDLTFNPLLYGGTRYDHVSTWESNTKSWTQEFNLSSNGNGPLQWIVGGVYLHSKNSQYVLEYRGSDDNLVPPVLSPDTEATNPLIDNITYAELSSITRKAWAIYGQGTLDLTDSLSVTAGLRYNKDKYTGETATNSDISETGPYLQPVPTQNYSTTEWTGKFALEYKFTPDNMIYASYTRGFKPGGINTSAAGGNSAYLALGWEDAIAPTYKPETVNSFEIGSKNQFLDRTAQLNLSAFYYDYNDLQFLEEDPIPYGEGTSNAPKAEIYGLELEGLWLLNDHWKIDGSASLLHGEFTKDYYALDPSSAADAQNAAGFPDWLFWDNFYAGAVARDNARQNINGNDVPKVPDFTGQAAITYNNVIAGGDFTARAQIIYRGKYSYRLFNNSEFDTTPSYEQVNLFFKYAPEDFPLDFSFTVTNLFDVEGVNSRFSDPYGSAQTMETYIPPRQAIFSVGFEF